MIEFSLHISVQKSLITLPTTPENVVFTTQIVCDLYIREIGNNDSYFDSTIPLIYQHLMDKPPYLHGFLDLSCAISIYS